MIPSPDPSVPGASDPWAKITRFHCVTQLSDDSWEMRWKKPGEANNCDDLLQADEVDAARSEESRQHHAEKEAWQTEKDALEVETDRLASQMVAIGEGPHTFVPYSDNPHVCEACDLMMDGNPAHVMVEKLTAEIERLTKELAEARQVQIHQVDGPDGGVVAAPCCISGCQYAELTEAHEALQAEVIRLSKTKPEPDR